MRPGTLEFITAQKELSADNAILKQVTSTKITAEDVEVPIDRVARKSADAKLLAQAQSAVDSGQLHTAGAAYAEMTESHRCMRDYEISIAGHKQLMLSALSTLYARCTALSDAVNSGDSGNNDAQPTAISRGV